MVNRYPESDVFVGRYEFIQSLENEIHQLKETNCGNIIFIAGEAGIGKTTLVNYFLRSLTSNKKIKETNNYQPYVLQAKCSDLVASGNPYAPFADLFDGFQIVETEGLKKTMGAWAKDLGPKLLEGIVPYLGPFLAGILEKQLAKDHESNQIGVNVAAGQIYQFLRLLDRASKISPLIIFIDDLHWADEPSINLIFALARRISEFPILLIGTYRPHDIAEKPGQSTHPLSKILSEMKRYNLYTEIELNAFSVDEVERFLVKHFPQNNFSDSLPLKLHNETNGNPFFLEQLLRLLKDTGQIFLDTDGRWTMRPFDSLPIPRGVLAIVQARINNLERKHRLILGYASVLGEQFRSKILSEILEEPHIHILRVLRILEVDHSLVRQKSGFSHNSLQSNWEFNHAYVHQALYDSLAVEERSEIHSLAADFLVKNFPESRNELASELAFHCEMAQRFEDAINFRLSAALRVHRARGFSEQVFHCNKGIAAIKRLASPKEREEIIFLSGLADAYRRFMKLQEVEDIANQLLDLAITQNNSMANIEGNLRKLQVAVLRGNVRGIRLYCSRAWKEALSTKPENLIPVIGFFQHENLVRGMHRVLRKQLKQLLDEAMRVFQNQRLFFVLSRVLTTRAFVAFLENEYDEALSFFNRAISSVNDADRNERHILNNFPFYTLYFDTNTLLDDCAEYIGRIHQSRGEWEKAIKKYEQVAERKEAENNLPGMAGLLNLIAETQLEAELFKEAQLSFERSWTIAQQTDNFELKAMVLSTGITIAIAEENISDLQARLQLFREVSHEWNVEWVWEKRRQGEDFLNRFKEPDTINEKILLSGLNQAKEDKDFYLIFQFNSRLANWYLNNDDLDKALQFAKAVLQTFVPKYVETDWIEKIGRIHQNRGEWEKAIKKYEQVFERKKAENNLSGMAGLLNMIAETQLQAEQITEAQKTFKRSWAVAQQTDNFELKAMVLSTGISIAIMLKNYRATEILLKYFEEITGNMQDIEWIRQKISSTNEILSNQRDSASSS
ncbi:MAG: hypothetical protein CL609_07565 [Anaerolineaceae bacterium]|nr:hypothetical protein [Anaerolineaceae bacterium]